MNQQGSHIEEHLLLQYLLGDLADTESAAVEGWLRESEANRATLDRLERLWLETGKLDPPPLAVDIDAAWKKVSSRLESKTISWYRHPMVRIAAVFLLLAGLSIIYLFVKPPSRIELRSELAVITDTLPDGTAVILNKESTLSYPEDLKGVERRIKLKGEALFTVVKDASRPFIVEAENAQVTVTGTVFDVSAYPGKDLVVVVTEGSVVLSNAQKDTLVLTAGQTGIIKAGAGKPVRLNGISPDILYWANQSLDFNATPLSTVFPVIEKNYGIRIITVNPSVLDCRLTASFSGDPADRIMEVIAESFGLTIKKEGSVFYVSGDGCR